MSLPAESQNVADKARRVYEERLKTQLEAEHFGEVIAVEPDSGEYVLGKNLMEVTAARRDKFGTKPTFTFRIGGGGAVKIGGAYLNGRISGRTRPGVSDG